MQSSDLFLTCLLNLLTGVNSTACFQHFVLLADRTNGRAYATVLRLSVVCRRRRRLFVTLCIVAKRCIVEQKLLLREPIGSRI